MTSGSLAGVPTRLLDPYQHATVLLVSLLVVMVGLDLRYRFGVSLTLVAALVVLPLWARSVGRYPLAPLIVGLGLASTVSAIVLAERSAVDHSINSLVQTETIFLFLSGLAALVILLWAREVLPLHRIVVLYAVGALASDILASRMSWKYDLSLPAALLVLGLMERHGIRRASAAVLMGFGLIGVLNDSRSFIAFCAMAAALTLWELRPITSSQSRWFPAMLMVCLGVATYLLVQSLLVGGYLGSVAQERTIEQSDATGSVLAGGRPEWAATRALVLLNPAGYGVGVKPNWSDLQAAKQGLNAINVDLETHRERYMFGTVFNLHSITSDLWVGYGWTGVALAIVICFALVRSLSFQLAARAAPTSVILLAMLGVWFMLFGPFYSNWLEVCVSLGLVLVTRAAGSPVTPHD